MGKLINHAVALATALFAMSAIPASAEPTELIFNTFLSPFEVTRQVAIKDFAERIEKESAGTIKIFVPDTSVAPINRQYEMLVDGLADMAILPANEMPQFVVLNTIADIPYNAPTAKASSIALWETYNRYFKPFDEYKNVVVLSVHTLPGRQFLGVHKPMASLDDIRGQKIWVPRGAMSEVVEKLGGVPVLTSFPDLFENVSKGLVDGLVMTPGSAKSARILDMLHHVSRVPGGIGTVSFAVAISKQRWDTLTADQQAAIRRAAEGLPGRTGAAVDEQEEATGREAAGLIASEISPEIMVKLKPILDSQVEAWKARAAAKGLENPAEVLDFYRQILKRQSE